MCMTGCCTQWSSLSRVLERSSKRLLPAMPLLTCEQLAGELGKNFSQEKFPCSCKHLIAGTAVSLKSLLVVEVRSPDNEVAVVNLVYRHLSLNFVIILMLLRKLQSSINIRQTRRSISKRGGIAQQILQLRLFHSRNIKSWHEVLLQRIDTSHWGEDQTWNIWNCGASTCICLHRPSVHTEEGGSSSVTKVARKKMAMLTYCLLAGSRVTMLLPMRKPFVSRNFLTADAVFTHIWNSSPPMCCTLYNSDGGTMASAASITASTDMPEGTRRLK